MNKKIIIGISVIAILFFSLGVIGADVLDKSKKKAVVFNNHNIDFEYYEKRFDQFGNDPLHPLMGTKPTLLIALNDRYDSKGNLIEEAGEMILYAEIENPVQVSDIKTRTK